MSRHDICSSGRRPLRFCREDSRQRQARAARISRTRVGFCIGLILAASPVWAFKWHQCPTPPIPAYPSALGATNAPFVHSGHELTILLNSDEVAATGGFSLLPNGNRIWIVFESLFGPPVDLPPLSATASSTDVLTFVFPDTEKDWGESLAGPVSIAVTVNGREVAQIDPVDLVALPPTNDVTSILLGQNSDQIVEAALGADGDVWIPAHFQGEPMSMPTCPGNFIHPLPVEIAGADVLGALPPVVDPLSRIRRIVGYLGDVVIGDYSYYGMLYPQRINLVHVAGTLGVSICRLNDAMDLVLRVKGDPSWSGCQLSPFRLAVRGSRPIWLRLRTAPLVPSSTERGDDAEGGETSTPLVDSFGNQCFPAQPQSTSPTVNERQNDATEHHRPTHRKKSF